jgi:phosphoglucomutase
LNIKDQFILSCACDTDHDRHGIVTKTHGLLPPNHFLAVAIYYLFQHRPLWKDSVAIGKTVVSSKMINLVAEQLHRKVYEVPVGFKWFVPGLLESWLGFGGEESAGASFLRKDGTVWTTDKDGFIPCLLAAEITGSLGKDPGEIYRELTGTLGDPVYDRIDAPATPEEKGKIALLSSESISAVDMAGEKIQKVLSIAPGNSAPIGGVKVETANSWFAARPSGTENIYKIYGESFLGKEHLASVLSQAQSIVADALRVNSTSQKRRKPNTRSRLRGKGR